MHKLYLRLSPTVLVSQSETGLKTVVPSAIQVPSCVLSWPLVVLYGPWSWLILCLFPMVEFRSHKHLWCSHLSPLSRKFVPQKAIGAQILTFLSCMRTANWFKFSKILGHAEIWHKYESCFASESTCSASEWNWGVQSEKYSVYTIYGPKSTACAYRLALLHTLR